MSFFRVCGLTAGYGGGTVLSGVSFALDAGCLLGVLGANGSGKTTLLKSLCGILPHSGTCTLEDTRLESLTPRRLAALCSYIPQHSSIALDISALDVVLMGFNPHLKLLEHPNTRMRQAAMQALSQVGLGGKEEVNYLHLSEGQKQLCILARTLVSGSQLLLLDEPESALDFPFRHRMLELLRRWLEQGRHGAVAALHDPSLALNDCDKLLLLSGGTVFGTIHPRSDTLEEMERKLSALYGPISLHRLRDRTGRSRLAMLRETEDICRP